MVPVYLIGGGGDHPERATTYGRFLRAAIPTSGGRLVVLAAADSLEEAEKTLSATSAIFTTLDPDVLLIGHILTPAQPLTAGWLTAQRPTGVFVCGGPTPLYQELLCKDRAWPDVLRAGAIPFGGVSAGAAVAADTAIVGGWQAQRPDGVRAVLYQGAGEGQDLLDVRAGLGLVPFTVEIHASQWGTLTRLLHALDLGRISEGWAIDENTLLQIDRDGIHTYGVGHTYHVTRDASGVARLTIHTTD